MQEQNREQQDPSLNKQGPQRDQGGAPGPGSRGSQINLDPTTSPETSAAEDAPVEGDREERRNTEGLDDIDDSGRGIN